MTGPVRAFSAARTNPAAMIAETASRYRERRNAVIAALDELLPSVRWQGAAAGLHLHVMLPDHFDEQQLIADAFNHHLRAAASI
jgi:DNA-binding transcriptional MocR family regulator